jgi:hypothetical protein
MGTSAAGANMDLKSAEGDLRLPLSILRQYAVLTRIALTHVGGNGPRDTPLRELVVRPEYQDLIWQIKRSVPSREGERCPKQCRLRRSAEAFTIPFEIP